MISPLTKDMFKNALDIKVFTPPSLWANKNDVLSAVSGLKKELNEQQMFDADNYNIAGYNALEEAIRIIDKWFPVFKEAPVIDRDNKTINGVSPKEFIDKCFTPVEEKDGNTYSLSTCPQCEATNGKPKCIQVFALKKWINKQFDMYDAESTRILLDLVEALDSFSPVKSADEHDATAGSIRSPVTEEKTGTFQLYILKHKEANHPVRGGVYDGFADAKHDFNLMPYNARSDYEIVSMNVSLSQPCNNENGVDDLQSIHYGEGSKQHCVPAGELSGSGNPDVKDATSRKGKEEKKRCNLCRWTATQECQCKDVGASPKPSFVYCRTCSKNTDDCKCNWCYRKAEYCKECHERKQK